MSPSYRSWSIYATPEDLMRVLSLSDATGAPHPSTTTTADASKSMTTTANEKRARDDEEDETKKRRRQENFETTSKMVKEEKIKLEKLRDEVRKTERLLHRTMIVFCFEEEFDEATKNASSSEKVDVAVNESTIRKMFGECPKDIVWSRYADDLEDFAKKRGMMGGRFGVIHIDHEGITYSFWKDDSGFRDPFGRLPR